jgi:hypothetical protein
MGERSCAWKLSRMAHGDARCIVASRCDGRAAEHGAAACAPLMCGETSQTQLAVAPGERMRTGDG